MPGYFVYELDVFDAERFSQYTVEGRDLLRRMGGEVVLDSDCVVPLEGGWNPPSLVVAKFPTLEGAQRFYESEDYQRLLAMRKDSARSRGVLIGSKLSLFASELPSPSVVASTEPGAFGLDYTPGMAGMRLAADPRMEERELGLGAVSGGKVRAKLLRARGTPGGEPLAQHCPSHCVLYVVRGSATMHDGSTGEQALRAGTAVYLPPDCHYRLANWSFDFELVALFADAAQAGSRSEVVYEHERPDSYVQGPPGREYLSLRHLRLADRTDRQMEVTVIKGRGAPAGGTGWHSHTNSEWVYILSGAAELGSADAGKLTIRAGDSLTFPPASVHAVHTFSDDYALLAVNAPADFRTQREADPTVHQPSTSTA